MMKKNIVFTAVLSMLSLIVQAQTTMKEVFLAMPDSILPTLTQNNRLDMVDFLDARMKAQVTNALDGTSELESLDAVSLQLKMSDALTIRMLLLDVEDPVDSALQVVGVIRSYRLLSDSAATESLCDYYSVKWQPLSAAPRLTPIALQRIALVQRPSTILKRDDELPTLKQL